MPDVSKKNLLSPCADREENLVLLHYGELAGEDAAPVRDHAQACAGCSAYLKDLATVLPLTVPAAAPAPAFWSDYDRELRGKIDAAVARRTWAEKLADFFRPRWVPALAATAVLALALTFTLGRGTWTADEPAREESALLELLPVAENLEFLNAMDILENLEVLESMGQGNAA